MIEPEKTKRSQSFKAFLAAGLFCLASVAEFTAGMIRGLKSGVGTAFLGLGVMFLGLGAMWVGIGVRYRRAESQTVSD